MSTTQTVEALQQVLCNALCANVSVREQRDGSLRLVTPFTFPDGDGFSMYLERLPSGGFKLTDKGITMMRLSYDHDVSKLREGTRARVFEQIVGEMGINDEGGEFTLETSVAGLSEGIFRLGQALTRIHDLSFLNRVQVESTFYEDLRDSLISSVGEARLIRDFEAPEVPDAANYLVDFAVEAERPVLIFGVPTATKARLATVIIQYLQQHRFRFHSLVVYNDMRALPRGDVARLTNAANDQVAQLDRTLIQRKLHDALRA